MKENLKENIKKSIDNPEELERLYRDNRMNQPLTSNRSPRSASL